MKKELIEKAYLQAREEYSRIGVDTDKVITVLSNIQMSLPCWQSDDVGGFEKVGAVLSGGGIQATGNFPGKAKTIKQVKEDIDKVLSLIPGKYRFNLHASYGEFGGEYVERDKIELKHFEGWIKWAKERGLGLDFNSTFFSHPLAEDGFTLSSKNNEIRRFWIEHAIRCRSIGAEMGRQLGSPTMHNVWIPDGSKDICVSRYAYRELLKSSLDEIFEKDYPITYLKDSIECKLFGIAFESMVVGSYDFYLQYALKNKKLITLDNGHFHPTEQVSDKISSILLFMDELMLHMTRGVRWDSDHVIIFNDEIQSIAQEIVRADAIDRVNISLDFFDASINRIGAYVVGARAAQLAFMYALLEPKEILVRYEEEGKYFERLAFLEVLKTKPFCAVWDYYCMVNDVPVGHDYIEEIQQYEQNVLLKR
jgi:L-rhamnose isomerase